MRFAYLKFDVGASFIALLMSLWLKKTMKKLNKLSRNPTAKYHGKTYCSAIRPSIFRHDLFCVVQTSNFGEWFLD